MNVSNEHARRIGISLGLALAAFAFLFLTRSLEQYGDGLDYLGSARSGTDLFHPHHLGYNAAVRFSYFSLRGLGFPIDILTAAQIHNILWALAALFGLACLVRRLTGSKGWAIAAAATLFVCQGFWEYSTQSQVYIPAMGAMAWTAWLAVGRPDQRWTVRRTAALAGLFVLSILYHHTAVLFLLPLALLLALSADPKSRLRLIGAGMVAGILILGLYIAAFLTMTDHFTVPGFLRFALSYTLRPNPSWGTWRNVGPAGVGYMIFSLLRNVWPDVRAVRILALPGFGLFLGGLCIWHAFRIRNRRDATAPVRVFLLAWLAIHCLFYLWWAPYDKNNFIIALFPLVLLIVLAGHDAAAGMSRSGRRLAASVFGVFLLGLGAINYAALIRPLHLSRGVSYAKAARLDACVSAGDYILSDLDLKANLAFYFQRPKLLLAEVPPICFEQDQALPEIYEASAGWPMVVPLTYLDPNWRFSAVSGYRRPEDWRRWILWLLRVELDARGEPISGRAFESLACGDPYLRIRPDRAALAGWDGFWSKLDEVLGPALGGRSRVFRDWAAAMDSKNMAKSGASR